MLTTNKSVYGTDGSLTNLGNLKGGTKASIVDIKTDADITGINLYIGSDDDFTLENLPYNTDLYITAWLVYDEGGIKVGHVTYKKRDKTTSPFTETDTDGEHLVLIATSHDNDFDLHLSGDTTHTIIYYEIVILKKGDD